MVSTSWYDISQLWVGTFFYGIYCVLFCICMHVLVHRPSSRGNTVLLVTAIALFTFSTILIVLILVIVTAEIEDLASIPSDSIQNAAYILYAINNSIADGLLIYRCYVVWNHNWRIIVVPVMLLIASTGCGLDIYLDPAPQFAVILATNFLATGLTGKSISWPLAPWRLDPKKIAQPAASGGSATILAPLIAESGMLYSATILAFLIVVCFPSLSSTLEEPMLQIVTQVMGIAPTLIIVRVGQGVTVEGSQTTTTTSIPLHHPRHARSRLGTSIGTSIGSLDPKENFRAGQLDKQRSLYIP
ncbi:hypothetical protein MSAN_00518700 [Mycena sanguinolenta]|uniref:Uncharacterized protein n=1 Tax=Mycena sanguinolenta TaxID=230812 RepID=A0A8H6Z8T6_9AGAR|nr:hypothetical protein MSAN_00518700 [Mycena sanguinolenta]